MSARESILALRGVRRVEVREEVGEVEQEVEEVEGGEVRGGKDNTHVAMNMKWEMFLIRRVDAVSRLEPHAHDETHVCVLLNVVRCAHCTNVYMCLHTRVRLMAGTLESNLAPVPICLRTRPSQALPALRCNFSRSTKGSSESVSSESVRIMMNKAPRSCCHMRCEGLVTIYQGSRCIPVGVSDTGSSPQYSS